MTDIFAADVIKAIDSYKLYIRKNLPQPERLAKLAALRLKQVNYYSDPIELFNAGWRIVKDVDAQLAESTEQPGYYSYSGIQRFSQLLRNYLQKFEVEEGVLIHMAQKASSAILKAIQSINGKSQESLGEEAKLELFECHKTIVHYGLREQFDIYRENLEKLKVNAPNFFMQVVNDFESRVQENEEGESGQQAA